MKIVIIGASGQLGMDCQKVLQSQHTLLTPAKHELNLCNEQHIFEFITSRTPDVVINCAAYTAVDRCEEEQRLCWQVNAKGPGVLAKACQTIGSRLIHVSTDYVFDGKKPVPQSYCETDRTNPLSHYGRTKLEGENAVRQNCDDHTIVRTAWLYSANGNNFLKTILRLSIENPETPRKVVNDQFGSLTWSSTLARQINKLLDSKIQGIVHGTANGHSTWYEAACYFLDTLGVEHKLTPCTTEEYPAPAHRPTNSLLANSVLESNDLSVFVDWKNDLDEFVRLFGKALLLDE